MTMVAMLARKASERDAPASRPEELKELARISERAVLEMRYLLQLIRVPGAVPSGPEHRDLTSLVDYEVTRAKSHGFSVKLVTSGLPAHLGSGSRLLLEKVLSEGISNVIRHGDPAREVLLMVHIDSSIELTIINRPAGDRRRPWPSSLSFGLTSVRELVEAAGGVVEADSQGGQWVLNVVLPQASQSPIVVTQEPSGTAGSDG